MTRDVVCADPFTLGRIAGLLDRPETVLMAKSQKPTRGRFEEYGDTEALSTIVGDARQAASRAGRRAAP